MLILDLWGISFHAVVVFALGKNLLFKSALGHCDLYPLEILNTCEIIIAGWLNAKINIFSFGIGKVAGGIKLKIVQGKFKRN